MPPRDEPHQRLSRNLKAARRAAGLTVVEAVKRLRAHGIQVGERYLRQWENPNDKAEPILSDAEAICEVYGCRLEDLFRP